MRILLTGDKGFIGAHLSEKLKGLGHDVKGYDLKSGLDIRDRNQLESVFKTFLPERVIHLAALTGVRDSLTNPAGYFETNITGTYYLLEMAEKYGVKNFLSASSSSVYGQQNGWRVAGGLREDLICDNQLSPYAVSKKAGELLCKMFGEVSTVVFRPFTVYGENGRKNMVVYKLINAGRNGAVFHKYGDGNSVRGYTNVHDLNEGIVKLIKYSPENNFEIFNLGGEEKVKLNDLIKIVKEEFPDLKVEQVERNPVDVLCSFADLGKVKIEVDYNPKRNFYNEIKKLCKNQI